MTVPGTDTLRGSAAAFTASEPWPSAGLAVVAGQELARATEWPLWTYLELRALPVSARSARMHARSILREWRIDALTDTVELLVSELITNAVRATCCVTAQPEKTGQIPRIRFWLTSDRESVLIQVWDSDHRQPVQQDEQLDAEAGRGLLLVDTLSARWGCSAPDGQAGKIVWALCAQ